MSPTLTRRPATEADVSFLYALRMESMNPHIVAAGLVCTHDEHMERVRDKLDSAEILMVNEAPAGMIKVARESGYWHIMQLQVVPALHGTGVGSAILGQVVAEAQVAVAQLTLDVLKANPAKHLYARMGFIVHGESLHEFEMVWRGSDEALLVELRGLERELHQACLRPDVARVNELVHEDFGEFGRSGKTWSKATLLGALIGDPGPALHAQDFFVHARTADSCMMTFRSADIGVDGQLSRHTLRSSLWVRADGRWQLLFHQGTACKEFERRTQG